MTSLYIHIPFCHKKCGYCSFPVIPVEKLHSPAGMADQYKAAVFRDIAYWAKKISGGDKNSTKKPPLYTIYFGGGTPLLLGAQYLIDILNEVEKYFDLTDLQELTIECNPYPYKETLSSVQTLIHTYTHLPRLRFSFGIQSLDDTILQQSNRDCTFAGLQQFTQDILAIKQANIRYNYDFIAFGDTNTLPADQKERLQQLITSNQIDSFSLYTLELFAGAKRYHETKDPLIAYQAPWDHDIPFATSEDSIFDQFTALKKLFLEAGYARYEISNYALQGKECLHNIVYWTMGSYIGIGLGAHGFINTQVISIDSEKSLEFSSLASLSLDDNNSYRTENTGGRKQYIGGVPENIYKTTSLDDKDILIESFFLGLRYSGVQNVTRYSSILKSSRGEAIKTLVLHGLCTYTNDTLTLTDAGMNLHHQVCTYLLETI